MMIKLKKERSLNLNKIKQMKKFLFSSGLLTLPMFAMAQAFDPNQIISPTVKVTRFEDFIAIFNTLISWMFTILLILSVIFIILAAFKYLTAGGDDEKIKSAHSMIIYAVVGLVVAFLAQGIRFVVEQLIS